MDEIGKCLKKLIICLFMSLCVVLSSCGETDQLVYEKEKEKAEETISSGQEGSEAGTEEPGTETSGEKISGAPEEPENGISDESPGETQTIRESEMNDTKAGSEQEDGQKKSEGTAAATESGASQGSDDPAVLKKEEGDSGIVTITISAVGDVSLGNYAGQNFDYSFDQTYEQEQNPAYFFANVREIFEADDLTIVNLEGPLTDLEEVRIEKEFEIKGKPEYVKILTEGDVEAATIANNHILDYTEQGRQDTITLLEDEGILFAYDRNLAVYETKGIKIGIVAVSALSESEYSAKIIKNGIDDLKEQEMDLIIVCCHWGEEYHYTPNEYQVNLGRECIDWGADLVLGCHPHILESIEEYKGKYIAYSMGNFCFGANRNPPDKDSMIFQPTFTFIDGVKQEQTMLKIIPCSISSIAKRNNYQPTPAFGEEAARIIDKINEISEDYGVKFDYDGRTISGF